MFSFTKQTKDRVNELQRAIIKEFANNKLQVVTPKYDASIMLFNSNVFIKSYKDTYKDRPYKMAVYFNGVLMQDGIIYESKGAIDKLPKLCEVYLRCLDSVC